MNILLQVCPILSYRWTFCSKSVPSLVIDEHFALFVLACSQVETFNNSDDRLTTDALDREKHVWFHGTYSMFTIDNCQTLSDWAILMEETPRPRVHQSRNLRQSMTFSNQKWTLDVLSHISVLRRWHGQWSSGICGTSKKYKRKIWYYEEIKKTFTVYSALINPLIFEG